MGVCTLSLVYLPVLGCVSKENDTDVGWFLSQTEVMAVGRSYHQNLFLSLDNDTVLINGWILTLAEAEVCKKIYLESA